MTEQPYRTSPTRSPHGTTPSRPPYQTRSPLPVAELSASATPSRPPIPPPLERTTTTRQQILRTAACLLLGAGFVVLGWQLTPHGETSSATSNQRQNRAQDHSSQAQSWPGQASTPLPAVSTTPAVNLPREPDAAEREPGLRHIATLQLAGSFAQAADYAVASPLDYRRDFTIAAFHEWGRHQPDQALASAIKIEEAFTRDWAVASVFSGWARTDPEGMAETALAFPDSDFKKAALTKALRAWMNKDPQIAGDWIIAHPDAVPVAEEMFRRDRR